VGTVNERRQIAWKWLISFSRSEWSFDDYPLCVRRNPVDDPSIAWFAHFLNWPGPGGVGPTAEAAIEDFRSNFAEVVKHRRETGQPMPRPGTRVRPVFAPSSRVTANPELYGQFIANVLGFGPDDPVFLSDQSSLLDFRDPEEVERLYGLIRSNFGVDASHIEGARIADILEYIASQKRQQ